MIVVYASKCTAHVDYIQYGTSAGNWPPLSLAQASTVTLPYEHCSILTLKG